MMTKNKTLNKGFYASNNRIKKAQKIVSVLEEESKSDLKNCVILDIGTGNGEISNYIANIAKQVISIDISDNRSKSQNNYNFLICDENLPFNPDFFDIVISNHVIEHVNNNELHLKEIYRVLKQDGIVYLATPNRLWPWEAHYKLFLLHYLPKPIFINILKRLNRYHEDLNLLFWNQLKKLLKQSYTLTIYCDRITREPNKYHLHVNKRVEKILRFLPLSFYTLTTFINPTFIITLRKKHLTKEKK